MRTTAHSNTARHTRIRALDRTGSAKPIVIFVIVAAVVASLATFMVIFDGRTEERQIDQSPPEGSVEGNLANLAAWAAEPIRAAIESTGEVPGEDEGGKLLESLASKARPEFYPPLPYHREEIRPTESPTMVSSSSSRQGRQARRLSFLEAGA